MSFLFTSECYVILLIIMVHSKVVKYDVPHTGSDVIATKSFFIYITYLLMIDSVLIFSNKNISM